MIIVGKICLWGVKIISIFDYCNPVPLIPMNPAINISIPNAIVSANIIKSFPARGIFCHLGIVILIQVSQTRIFMGKL